MSAHLEDRVALWLSTHPGSTVEQIARGVQSRNVAVRDVLSGPLFTYSNVGGARLYRVGLKAADGLGRAETDKEFLLRVLSDGEPHTLNEILRRSFADRGCGLTVHSRASDLRADGYRVENWKDGERGNGSWYRLGLLGAGMGVAHSPTPTPSRPPIPPELETAQDGSTADEESALSGAGDLAAESGGQLVLAAPEFRRGQVAA